MNAIKNWVLGTRQPFPCERVRRSAKKWHLVFLLGLVLSTSSKATPQCDLALSPELQATITQLAQLRIQYMLRASSNLSIDRSAGEKFKQSFEALATRFGQSRALALIRVEVERIQAAEFSANEALQSKTLADTEAELKLLQGTYRFSRQVPDQPATGKRLRTAINASGTKFLRVINGVWIDYWDTDTRNNILSELLEPNREIGEVLALSPKNEKIALVTNSEGLPMFLSLESKPLLFSPLTGNKFLPWNRGHTKPVTVAKFNSDGSRILTGSEDKTAKLWDAQTGQVLVTFRGHKGTILSVGFSADEKIAFTTGNDGRIYLWDTTTGQMKNRLLTGSGYVNSATLTQDGKTLYATTNSGRIEEFHFTSQLARSREIENEFINKVQLVLRDQFFLATTHGKVLLISREDETRPPQVVTTHTGYIHDASISSNLDRIVSVDGDGKLHISEPTIQGANLKTDFRR